MEKLSYAAIQETLNQTDMKSLPALNISVLRNIMIEPIEPYLRYHAYNIGFNAQIKFGEYDNIMLEAVGRQDFILDRKTDVILVFMILDTLSWSLARNFTELQQKQVQAEVDRIQEFITTVLAGVRDQTDAMILWHGFESPVYPSLGIYDSQTNTGQLAVIQGLNAFLKDSLVRHQNAYFVNMNLCRARVGAKNFYDVRYWHIGRAPYTREALSEIAGDDFKYIRALKGKNKKCLVLDCDNTLWGGVIGEDGLSGIKLGKTHPGSAYYEFQQEIVNLYHRGVIIALCSKNNEADVWEVFRKHPDMILKEAHIAVAQINWQDKAANLRQIATDLNIGLDSIVFMDDSEFEINLIRQVLPEIEAIHLPANKAIEYRSILSSCGLFDTLTISDEDRMRGAMYKAETHRKKMMVQITDMNEYYKSLGMIVEIRFADEFSLPRIAQLTQKTNQFNLTTRRYSEADIKTLAESETADVLYVKLQDNYGDSGIVGVCILKYHERRAICDTLLLSCRVLGRGVEDAFLIHAEKLAFKKDCVDIIGEYYKTKKNAQVENFYGNKGFEQISDCETNADRVFCYKFSRGIPDVPGYFKEVTSEVTE